MTIQKNIDAFSFTEKIKDYLLHPDWQDGYEYVSGGGDQIHDSINGMASFYRLVSGAHEDIAGSIYERVSFFANNLIDVDTCELLPLYSMAKMLNYDGDLNFLTYPYPKEIYDTLSILSIKSSILISPSNGFLTFSETLKNKLKEKFIPWAKVSSILNSDGETVPIADPSIYSDIEFQIGCIKIFNETLSGELYAKYVNMDGSGTQIIDNETLWPKFDRSQKLFSYSVESSIEITNLKLRIGVDLDFNEVDIVNSISANQDSLNNYTTVEQIVLNAELDRRSGLSDKTSSTTRFNPERERKVQEYIAFCENYVCSVFNRNETYDLNDRNNYTEIHPVLDRQLKYTKVFSIVDNSGTSAAEINDGMVKDVATQLKNTAISISYLRDELKILSRKYAIKGSFDAINIGIKELFKKNIYGQSDHWRKMQDPFMQIIGNGADTNFDSLIDTENLSIELLEYWDSNEYFNIDKNINYNELGIDNSAQTSLNSQYWTDDVNIGETFASNDEYVGDISKDSIYEFYKLQRSLMRDNSFISDYLDPNTASDDYQKTFEFLSSVYNAGCTTGIENSEFSTIRYPSKTNIKNTAYLDLSGSANTDLSICEYLVNSAHIEYDENLINPTNGIFVFDVIRKIKSTALTNTDTKDEALKYVTNNPLLASGVIHSGTCNINNLSENDNVISGDLSNFSTSQLYEIMGNMSISGNVISTDMHIDEGRGAWEKYNGGALGKAPWKNYKNSIHSSYALHPYLPRFTEMVSTIKYSLQNLFVLTLKSLIQDIEYTRLGKTTSVLFERIDNDGNTINSWQRGNIEYTGYQTAHEVNKNKNTIGKQDFNVGVDGPWNPLALEAFLSDPALFREEILNSEYYDNIGLTDDEKTITSGYLDTHEQDIVDLANKSIYAYSVDLFDNHYMLYKSAAEFDETGEIWVRYNSHPIAFPLTTQLDNSSNSLGAIEGGFNNAYDFGMLGNWMWVAHNQKTSSETPDYSSIHPHVNITEIIKSGNSIKAQNDEDHTITTFVNLGGATTNYLADNNLTYVGVASTTSDLILITASTGTFNNSIAVTGLIFYQFSPYNADRLRSGVFATLDNMVPIKTIANVNVFRFGYNGDDLLSVGFESEINTEATIQNYWNISTTSSSLSDVYKNPTDKLIDIDSNGIGLINVNFYPDDNRFSIKNIQNSFPISDAGYIPIIGQDYRDLFGQTLPCAYTFNNLDDIYRNDANKQNNISYNIQYMHESIHDADSNWRGFVTTDLLREIYFLTTAPGWEDLFYGFSIRYEPFETPIPYSRVYETDGDENSKNRETTDDTSYARIEADLPGDDVNITGYHIINIEHALELLGQTYIDNNQVTDIKLYYIGQTVEVPLDFHGLTYKYIITLVGNGKLNIKLR